MTPYTHQTPPAPPKFGSPITTELPIPFGINFEKSFKFCDDFDEEVIYHLRTREKVRREKKIKMEDLCAY